MMLMLLRRFNFVSTVRINPRALTCFSTFRFFASTSVSGDGDGDQSIFAGDRSSQGRNWPDELMLSPLVSRDQSPLTSTEIKVVDSDTWELSSGLARFSKSYGYGHQKKSFWREEFSDEACGDSLEVNGELDIDEIEDMRIHGSLFYKIDRGSKEFEEYKFDYHGRKPRYDKDSEKDEAPSNNEPSLNGGKKLRCREERKEGNEERTWKDNLSVDEQVSKIIKDKYIVCTSNNNADGSHAGKKQRKPTFNQLTGPYHEPFCLDIYISKQSVRACVVHRVTSKVVAVAHSISKDMKCDLGSTRNAAACAAVGKVLAHRALADDIHDVIFTPRKGEKLEGKLQIVLQSIKDNGCKFEGEAEAKKCQISCCPKYHIAPCLTWFRGKFTKSTS